MMNRFLALVLAMLFTPVAGLTQSANDQLTQGVQAYNDLECETAIARLNDALQRGLSKTSQVEAYQYLGFCYIEIDRLAEAQQAFEKLLTLNPAYALDPNLWPPKYRGSLNRSKQG